jgi:uncharacterized membrane protein YGL010W
MSRCVVVVFVGCPTVSAGVDRAHSVRLQLGGQMRTLVDHLSNYADYHRDRRNIATHFVGIPAIVAAVAILLSRPAIDIGLPLALSPAVVVVGAVIAFYFRLDGRFGLAMTVALAPTVFLGAFVASLSTSVWLGVGVGLFVVGWLVQFLGHFFEGKKPAFVDDLVGLVIGPLFVVAEVAFALGLRPELAGEIVRRSGPTRVGRPSSTTATLSTGSTIV